MVATLHLFVFKFKKDTWQICKTKEKNFLVIARRIPLQQTIILIMTLDYAVRLHNPLQNVVANEDVLGWNLWNTVVLWIRNGRVVRFHRDQPNSCSIQALSSEETLLHRPPWETAIEMSLHPHPNHFLNLVKFYTTLYEVLIYSTRSFQAVQTWRAHILQLLSPSQLFSWRNRPFHRLGSLSEGWRCPSWAEVWGSQQGRTGWTCDSMLTIFKIGSLLLE